MNDIAERMYGRYPELRACERSIADAYELLRGAFAGGGKLLLAGNGGSASDCEHVVGELMKGFMLRRTVPAESRERLLASAGEEGAYLADRLQGALPAISLVSHTALSTAYINDVAADMVFAQQVYGYGRPGDALMVFSTSGHSANVVRAVQVAKAQGLRTIGLTGADGGKLKALCDVAVRVPCDGTPDIQERHLPIYHTLCMMLEEAFFG